MDGSFEHDQHLVPFYIQNFYLTVALLILDINGDKMLVGFKGFFLTF